MSRAVFFALCATLGLLPLPFGGTEDWSIFAFEAIAFGLGLITLLADLIGKKPPSAPDAGAPPRRFLPLLGFVLLAVFFLITIFQFLPLPASWVRTLSPRTYEIISAGARALGDAPPAAMSLSLSPALSRYEFLKYAAYLVFALLVFRHLRTRRDMTIFVRVLLASALFQSAYGLFELFNGTSRIFSWKNIFSKASAFGTFINRNHFAGYLEMIFPLVAGYWLSLARPDSRKRTWRENFASPEKRHGWHAMVIACSLIFIGLAVIFSRSRMGILIFLITAAVMSVPMPGGTPEEMIPGRRRRSGRPLRILIIVVLLAAALIGINPVISRFTKEKIPLDRGRMTFYRNTLELAGRFPAFGIGPGTFIHAYPMVEKIDEFGLLNHVHNDYLEVLLESGLIAGGCLILAAAAGFLNLLIGWKKRRDPFIRAVVRGAIVGLAAILVHSLVDFNLRIPATAATFFSILAMALRAVRLPPCSRRVGDDRDFAA